jgi:hypothetical protein
MLAPRFVLLAAMAAPLTAQLAGVYTINPAWPAVGANFDSLAAAVASLTANGVAGPVTFELYDDAGPFNEAATFVSANGPYAPQTAVLVMTSWTGASSANRVTFRAAAGEAPVFDATGRAMGVFWGGADYVTLDGIEIRNAPFDAISLYAEASHGVAYDPIIRRCRIHDCGGTGVTVYGNSSYPVNTLIEGNWFWRLQLTNAGSFNTTGRFGYITTRRSTNTRVVHNTFLMDTGTGTSCCAIGAYPSGTAELPYAEISNNVFLKTGAAGQPIFRFQAATGTTAPVPTICDSNCCFDLTASPFALWGAGAATTANSLLDWQTNAQRDLASVWADPQLRDLAGFDLHLRVTSPCLAASTVDFGPSTDIDGQPRQQSRDLGADEFSSAALAVVGTGCAGTGSLVPELWSNEWPFLGNSRFALFVRRMPAFAPMFVAVSFGTSPVAHPIGAGCGVHLPLAFLTALPVVAQAGPVGTASLVVPWPANGAYAGVNFGFQALAIDPGAPLGVTLTNALDVVLGF